MSDILVLGRGRGDHNQKYIYRSKCILFTTEFQVAAGRFFSDRELQPYSFVPSRKTDFIVKMGQTKAYAKIMYFITHWLLCFFGNDK